MTLSIQQQHHVTDVGFFATTLAGANMDASGVAPMPTLAPPPGPGATPLETISHLQQLASVFNEAVSSGDPSVLMAAVASMLRRNQTVNGQAGIQNDQTSRRAECGAQIAAYNKAQAAQQSAATWGLIAKIGAYVGAGLAAVVGVCGAAFSGGTSLLGGVVLAAVLISSAATITAGILQDTHVIQGPPPRWFSICVGIVGIVGAVASLGVGAGGVLGAVGSCISAAASTVNVVADVGTDWHLWPEPPPWFRMVIAGASLAGGVAGSIGSIGAGGAATAGAALGTAARAANSVSNTVQATAGIVRGVAAVGEGVAQVTQGIGTIGSTVCTNEADNDTADAKHHETAMARIGMQLDDLLDALKHVMASCERQMQAASNVGHEISTGRLAVIGNIRMA